MQKALNQPPETLLLLIEQAPVSIAIFDRDMRYLAASRRWAQDYGRGTRDLIGLCHYDILSDMPEHWREAHQRGLAGESVRCEEDEWPLSDGSRQWLCWAVHPWRDAFGECRGVIIFVEDITARKEAERRLRQSEERFHQLFDRMLEGCQIIGFDWRYRYLNTSAARHARAPAAELLGRTVMEAFPGIEETETFAALSDAMQARVARRLETHFVYADGSDAWFDLSVQPSPEGIFLMSIDISERKRAEAQLKESDARFRQLTESLPQLIWTCDAAGRCEFLSSQWEAYTGVPVAEQLGTGWQQRIHPEDVQPFNDAWTAALSTGSDFQCEFRLQRRDGEYRWFDARGTAQPDAQGRPARWFGANTDIENERRGRDDVLRSQKMEALGTLAGGIAHDFNNLLLAIRGNTTLALGDTAEDHPARQSLLEIEQASNRAADLVRRILTFSRKEKPRRAVMHLGPVTDEALQLLRATLPAQIELRTHYDADVPLATCDATQVHQVLMNLATNAVHAIGSGPGAIDVSLASVHVDQDHLVPGLRRGSYVCLSVADNGCGMDARTLARIFDPFFTTKPVGRGTGLGLSVVEGIMKAHGGAVLVSSERGKGTAFHLYFPATASPAPQPAAAQVLAAPAHGQRVLYVDDDEALVSLAMRTLTRLGYTVTAERDPQAALALFSRDPGSFDAVITDLSMPRLPGFALARELLRLKPGLPVIVHSGYLRPSDQQTARRLGVRALIAKPGSLEELSQVLANALHATD